MTAQLYYRGDIIYSDLSGYNISTLKELARSPKHYRHRLRHPRQPTGAMSLGTTGHIAILEPERFLREYVLWRAQDEDGKTCQRRGKKWDAFKAANPGKTIIRDEEYDIAIALKDAVRADETAMQYLGVGRPEVALAWTDAETGLPCKGRFDWDGRHGGRPWVVDLKGTRDASPSGFSRQVARLGYHLQCAFYRDGYEQATGTAPGVAIVAVEFEPPHDVVTYIVPDDVLDIGRDEYRKLLVQLKDCEETKRWPGYGRGLEQILQLPAWAVPEEEGLEGLGLEP